ncbi:glycoside hydrolase family 25 protein [Flavobacterium sp.]|uniref:glycoside hydrolase family 25 protein n=1 Tax=Flavobacterium sp. TaxID=239 RepID=UPI0039E712EF
MMLKKIMLVLAFWFLADWAYHAKIKPFMASEFGIGTSATSGASASGTPANPSANATAKDSTATANKDLANLDSKHKDSVVYGVDISHYQGNILNKVKNPKTLVKFVVCKATEGISIIDSRFKGNAQILKQKQVVRGAYHFYHCELDPLAQAQHFSQVILAEQFLDNNQLPPVLDIENGSMDDCSASDLATVQKNILIFLSAVQKMTGRTPMIYADRSTGNKYLNSPAFAVYPLWIAAYVEKLTPHNIPNAWDQKWMMWQRSESYSFEGEHFDCDVFNGSHSELEVFIQSTIIKDSTAAH